MSHAADPECVTVSVEFLAGHEEAAAVASAHDADLVVILAEESRAEGLDSQGTGPPDGHEQLSSG
jgi:hypothetical protein